MFVMCNWLYRGLSYFRFEHGTLLYFYLAVPTSSQGMHTVLGEIVSL